MSHHSQRLPWQPHPEGGFIAYPDGMARQDRSARLIPKSTGPIGAYTWWVTYDGQSIASVADSKQAASDEANSAWPRVIAAAARAAERAAWERNTIEMIAKAERGELDPNYFANEAANYENMMWVMQRLRRQPGLTARLSEGAQRIVDALSAEFNRRRKGR